MTPAEFKTLRDFLGLSVSECAEFLGVQERSVLHWSSKREAPEELQLKLIHLNSTIQSAVSDILEMAFSLRKNGENTIYLYRYRKNEDIEHDLYLKKNGLKDGAHGLLIARARDALQINDFVVHICFIDIQEYFSWLDNSKDTNLSRHNFLLQTQKNA